MSDKKTGSGAIGGSGGLPIVAPEEPVVKNLAWFDQQVRDVITEIKMHGYEAEATILIYFDRILNALAEVEK